MFMASASPVVNRSPPSSTERLRHNSPSARMLMAEDLKPKSTSATTSLANDSGCENSKALMGPSKLRVTLLALRPAALTDDSRVVNNSRRVPPTQTLYLATPALVASGGFWPLGG